MKFFLIILFIGFTFAVKSSREKRNVACSPAVCKRPDCHCSETSPPSGIDLTKTPQIVMLTYDDAVSSLNYNTYYVPLLKKRVNPNGCPISATFFVSHEYTDYSYVQQLYYEGHEIAVHSITHRTPIQWWSAANYESWKKEMAGQREIINHFGKVKLEDIVGIRTPFLQPGADDQFKMMQDEKFLYDSSLSTHKYISPPLWPYTFDFSYIQECNIPRCPKESHPGIWEVPLVSYIDSHQSYCAMVDSCFPPNDEAAALQLLKDNFHRHYNSASRAPFPVFLHAAWFQLDHNFKAMKSFLNYIQEFKDVYIVSVKQAIDWIKDPTPLSDINNFVSWNYTCNDNHQREKKCKRAKACPYKTSFGMRYMSHCGTCTPSYPWFNNTSGEGPMP